MSSKTVDVTPVPDVRESQMTVELGVPGSKGASTTQYLPGNAISNFRGPGLRLPGHLRPSQEVPCTCASMLFSKRFLHVFFRLNNAYPPYIHR